MNDPYAYGRWYYAKGYRPRGPAGEIDPGEPAARSRTRTITTFGITITDHTTPEETHDDDH